MSQTATILVVDDNPVVLTNMVELLRSAGYVVLEAATSHDCLRLAREHQPDLVLMDVILPDLDGVELCRRFKVDRDLSRLFVVLISSSETSSGKQVTGLEAGADGYIARPIDNRELLARVQAMLRIQQVEKALREAQEELERRVKERTMALSNANKALTREIEERVKAEETQRRLAERLRIVHAIDEAILAAKSPQAIASGAVSRLQKLVPYEYASVVEINAEFGRAEILATFGRDGQITGGGWSMPANLIRRSRALQTGEPLAAADAANLFEKPLERKGEPQKRWRFILDLPMATENILLGLLNLATDRSEGFTAEQREIAMEIASKLAVALRQARFVEKVSAGRERLRDLSQRLVEVQETERRFLARELHDEIGQALTGAKMVLDVVHRESSAAVRPRVEDALAVLNELMERVRRLSLDLRPQMLDDLGLLIALEAHVRRYSKQTNIRVEFKHTALSERLPQKIETALYRIAQEALTNVARHSGAKEVTLRLWSDPERAGLQVEDDGAGFDTEQALGARSSTGLTGMKERAETLGGEFTLESARGKGTRMTVELPLPDARAGRDERSHGI